MLGIIIHHRVLLPEPVCAMTLKDRYGGTCIVPTQQTSHATDAWHQLSAVLPFV